MGLGIEAGYKSFVESGGRLEAASVPNLILKGGDLQVWRGGAWHSISLVEVVLSAGLKSFIVHHVRFLDNQLALIHYNVLKVDADAGQKAQSHDLWGFFRGDRAPVHGHVPLEHKLVFGRKGFAEKVEAHKEQVKNRFLKQKGLAAQLLWVTQVAGHTELTALRHKLLMYKKGGAWKDMLFSTDPICKDLCFEDIWKKCRKEKKLGNKRTEAVQVAQFLRFAGKGGFNLDRNMKRWTSETVGLNFVKGRDFWCQPSSGGRGSKAPWFASESTLRRLLIFLTS